MKVPELYTDNFVVSFEIFPPKTEKGEEILWKEMETLCTYKPGYISVTYGAGGSTREKTLEIAGKIKEEYRAVPLLHFTCVGFGRDDIKTYLQAVKKLGIENILALRGDPPAGEEKFTPPPDGFSYANELITYIKSINGFTIGGAGYPEGHIEAPNFETDMDNLKKKVDAGAEFIITQLFYDNSDYFRFIDALSTRNIDIPVIPGIMPVTNLHQVQKITGLCGATIPETLMKRLESCDSKEHLCQAGIEYSIQQVDELVTKAGVPGLHIYTVNRSYAAAHILDSLNLATKPLIEARND